jgi:hypothetical protein
MNSPADLPFTDHGWCPRPEIWGCLPSTLIKDSTGCLTPTVDHGKAILE